MTAEEAIAYIENYTWSTTRLGLERTRTLLRALGDPQKELKFIHVAGSNGKGSTCAMLEAVLRAAGYRTGLYISPYIQDFCERIQINGVNIPGEDLARITERVRCIADAMEDHPSQFELVTAIAMQYYREQHCDLVVLEVGMGGALDSTNAIDAPEVAVITNLGLEHTEYLGDTLEKIAEAKGGIIKPGCACVCYDSAPEAVSTIRRICDGNAVPCHIASEADLQPVSHSLDGQCFLWKGQAYTLSLLGPHQLRNAGVVLETLDALRERGWEIPEEAVKAGLNAVRWPARFEVLWRDPLFVLDGGHNPQCAEALARNLEDYLPDTPLTILIGVLADKDYRQMLAFLLPHARSFVCITPESPRALPAEKLVTVIAGMGGEAQCAGSMEDGIRLALEKGLPVLAFGSLYSAGHIRTAFPRIMKALQRKLVLQRRDALPAGEHREASRRICEKITALPQYADSSSIFLFRAFRSELDLSAVAEQAERDGKIVLYPYCPDKTTMLALRPGEHWETGRFGIEVPVLEESAVWDPAEIDLILCPCTAFDDQGNRLGLGAGYYDRFLPQCRKAYRILTAFEVQHLPAVCTEGFDVGMDAIITESRTEFYDE